MTPPANSSEPRPSQEPSTETQLDETLSSGMPSKGASSFEPQMQPLVRPERKATRRLGQRQLSMISASVVLFVVGALGYGAYRLFVDFKNTRDIMVAEDNMHALHKAVQNYAADWDNKLPDAAQWTDQVTGYLSAPPNTPGGKMAYLHGEDEHGQALHYVYNDLASGYKTERVTPQEQRTAIDPGRMVLFIEMPGEGANAHVRIPPRNTPEGEDTLAKLLTFPHDPGDPSKAVAVIIYANGSTERLTRNDFK